MSKKNKDIDKPRNPALNSDNLFDRVVSILEQARSKVVQAVNSEMIIAYWLIGREIIQEIQSGDERAAYGKKVLSELSKRRHERYGKGFSVTNLRYFRLFYQTYAERLPEIRHKACGVLADISLAVEKSDSKRENGQ